MRRLVVGAVTAGVALTGCAVPYDGDGEVALAPGMAPAPAAAPAQDAVPVVVDTDLGGDDLAALAFLLRHPGIDVRAVTVAGGGLVGCDPGVDLVADLLTGLQEEAVPVACTATAPGGRAFPDEWRALAATGTGIPRPASTLEAQSGEAWSLVARLTRRHDDLVLVALGPMTTAAELARRSPDAYARLAGVHAMGGSVDGEPVDGVAEWNAAADPAAFDAVLGAGVPVTLVPEDAVPEGTPDVLGSDPVVARVAASIDYPAWWDLAAAAALVTGPGETTTGRWVLDPEVPGRLVQAGDDGDVEVVRSLDQGALEAAYADALG